MQSGKAMLENLLNALLPNRAAPALGRVIKAHEGPGKNTYSVDVRIVTAGTLEETDQVISEVPISPIWTSKKGKGIYAVPPENSIVIVSFIAWNPAYPYISGVYSDEYDSNPFKKNQLVITDGKDLRIEFSDDEITVHDSNQFKWRFIKSSSILSDGYGLKFGVDTDALYFFQSRQKSLKDILEKIIDEIIALKTQGHPSTHFVSPVSVRRLQAIKPEIAKLLK